MPKRKIYSQTELIELSLPELEKVVNRESERINRQLSRARLRGENLAGLYTAQELERPLRQEKLARYLDKLEAEDKDPQAALLKMYAALQDIDFTRKGVRERMREREELFADLDGGGGLEPEDLTPEQIAELRKARRRATGEAGAFYQLLVKAVESGVAGENGYSYFRKDNTLYLQTLTRKGRAEFINEQIEKINRAIVDENKQRDEKGVEKKKDLISLLELMNAAKNN